VGRLELSLDTREAFAGLMLRMHIGAYNTSGSRMSSNLAVVTSSNPSVAGIHGVQTGLVLYPNASFMESIAFIAMMSEGPAVIRVKLGQFTDSVVLNVRPRPLATNALVVDSFTVIEYYACTSCNRLTYAPLLKLREPTGTSSVDVIAVEFDVPTMSTGYCTTGGGIRFSGGLSAHVNYIDPEYYNNDMIFSSVSGGPVPDGPASAEVIVRDASGNYGLIEATGSIQRLVSHPTFPPATFVGVPWSCNSRWP
jgi:hypothetical protein